MTVESLLHNPAILARLKADTAAEHRQTEQLVNLLREDYSLAEYRQLLVRMFAFYEPFESRLQAAVSHYRIAIDDVDRSHTPKLCADLKHLGITDDQLLQIERFAQLPQLASPEQIFGRSMSSKAPPSAVR